MAFVSTMPLEFRRRSGVAAGAKSVAEGAATERAVAGTDATFAALGSALDGNRGVVQQRALRRMAEQSPAVQNLARLQRMIARPDASARRDIEGRAAPAQFAGTTAVPVAQRVLKLSTRHWSEATAVTVLRLGVYQVHGQSGESLVIKTSADMESTLDEYVGAKVGQFMGVNTIDTVAVRTQSEEIKEAIPYFEKLGSGGKELAEAITSSKHEFILVMPFIEGSDLKKSKAAWEEAPLEQQQEWAEEMGKAWLLDLVLQNTDRHSENFRIGKSGKLYAFDQSVGPGLKHEFGKEQAEMVLADLSKSSERYYDKLTSGLDFKIDQKTFYGGFYKGVFAARESLNAIEPETIAAIYEMMGQQEVELPGLEGVLAAIKKGL